MGKATIIEHLGSAFYRVSIDRSQPMTVASIAIDSAAADSIEASLPGMLAEKSVARQEMEQKKAVYEADQLLIGASGISDKIGEYLAAFAVYEGLAEQYNGTVIRLNSIRAGIAKKQQSIEPRIADLWCSTYSTTLAVGQDVATIEVGRQGSKFPDSVIAPLGKVYEAADGKLTDVLSMTPAQAFMNYALIAGATKWRRLYSTASVQEVDTVAEKLRLWIATFNSAGIYIHPESMDTWLPYIKRCQISGLGEYVAGDRVLIEHDSATHEPLQVVGWAEYPRLCFGALLKTLTLEEAIAPRKNSNVSECPDSYNLQDSTYITVRRIDALAQDIMHGQLCYRYPVPTDHHYTDYRQCANYNGYLGHVPPELEAKWRSAQYDYPHWREAVWNGELIRYDYPPWGENDYAYLAVPTVSIIQPTDFTTIERFFGDGEIRSIRAEFGGRDTLAGQRGEIPPEEMIYDIDRSDSMIILQSEYSIQKMVDHINNFEIPLGTNGGTPDPQFQGWEELRDGLLSGSVVMAVSHIYCDAEFSYPYRGYSLRLEVKLFKAQ